MTTIIHPELWQDKEIAESSPFRSLLLLYLLTNSEVSNSGIYSLSLRRASIETKLPLAVVRHLLGVERLTEEQTAETLSRLIEEWAFAIARDEYGLNAVRYDPDSGCAFLVRRLAYLRHGNPDWLARGIEKEVRFHRRARQFWKMFGELYEPYLRSRPRLRALVEAAAAGQSLPEKVAAQKQRAQKTVKTMLEDDEAKEDFINETLARLTSVAQDQEDRDVLLRVLASFLKTKRGLPRSLSQRYEVARRLAKEPPELVGRAAYLFEKAGGRKKGLPFKYFVGIMNGSARSWYVEYRAAREKNDFSLEETEAK